MQGAKYQLCPACEGEGKVTNPACAVWTASAIKDDPEGFRNMLDGHYDITCPCCQGLRVVTDEMLSDYGNAENDRLLSLREQGIYPGHPDYF